MAKSKYLDKTILEKTFSIKSLGGQAIVKVWDVSPQTPVLLRKRKGVWDGCAIIFTQTDSSGLIGIYDRDVAEVTIRLRPADDVMVTIRDEAEICRLWDDDKIVLENK